MCNLNDHALLEILNAFLEPLGDKFERLRPDVKWTPRVTAIALFILVLENSTAGYEALLSTVRMTRNDLLNADSDPSTFCRARRKLMPALLTRCWSAMRTCITALYQDIHPAVGGYRLVAIDGVWINGPRARTLFRQLRKPQRGRPPKNFAGQPQILAVCLVDVMTRTPIAWEYVVPGCGERSAAQDLVKHLDDTTLLLADRGFPSRVLLDELLKTGTKMIVRMCSGASAFEEVRALDSCSTHDSQVRFSVGKGKQSRAVMCRLVRGYPVAGTSPKSVKPEEWVLLTNLPRHAWHWRRVLTLYHERWGIEVFFRELKSIIGIDRFHAHDFDGIQAEMTMAMLAASLMSAAELIALTVQNGRMPTWDDVTQKRCNRSVLAKVVLNIVKTNPLVYDVTEMIDNELRISALRARKRRPGRSYPRICKSFYGKWKNIRKKHAA